MGVGWVGGGYGLKGCVVGMVGGGGRCPTLALDKARTVSTLSHHFHEI